MRKDIKHLTKDIEDAILMGKSIAASEIHFTLQHRSPFWSGTFNRSWKVQKGSPVAAVKPRADNDDTDEDSVGSREVRSFTGNKQPKKGELIPTELNEDLYVGNEVDYAAFVINEKRHPDDGTMYEDLFKEKKNTTPVPNSPDWYDVYLKTSLIPDLDEGFSQFGLK